MVDMNEYVPGTGKMLRSDGSVVNLADSIDENGKLMTSSTGGGGEPGSSDTTEATQLLVKAQLIAILAKLPSDPATETALEAILAKLITSPATEATLASILTAVDGLETAVALLGTQTTSAATLATMDELNDKFPAIGEGIGITQTSVVIPNGTSIMAAGVNLNGRVLLGYIMPTTWSPAAALSFQSSPDDTVTYRDIFDTTGTEISHTVVASHHVKVSPSDWVGIGWLKIRSGLSAAAINQSADRTIILLTKAV